MRFTGREDLLDDGDEVDVGRIIGPNREDSPWFEPIGEASQSLSRVEGGVAGMKVMARSVVDVDEDCVASVGCEAKNESGRSWCWCHSITAPKASMTCSERTRGSSATARAV